MALILLYDLELCEDIVIDSDDIINVEQNKVHNKYNIFKWLIGPRYYYNEFKVKKVLEWSDRPSNWEQSLSWEPNKGPFTFRCKPNEYKWLL